jgi:hypothetical protein
MVIKFLDCLVEEIKQNTVCAYFSENSYYFTVIPKIVPKAASYFLIRLSLSAIGRFSPVSL